MRETPGSLQGWVGPWIAFAVLFGWRLWVALAGWVSPTRPVYAVAGGLAVFGLVAIVQWGRRRRSGSDLPVLLLWISAGWLAGARATHPVPVPGSEFLAVLETEESRYHAVRVDRVSASRWGGTLYATLIAGRWHLIEPALPVAGRSEFPGKGDWIVRAALRPAWLRPPQRTGTRLLEVERAFRLSAVRSPRGEPLLRWERARDRWRRRVVERWHQVFGERVGGFAGWVLLGVRPKEPDALREPFVRTGTAHLLAISGLHVGILAGAVWSLLRLVLRRPRLARRLTAVVLLGYAALTGGAVSVLRSSGMFLLVALGPAWGRLGRGWNALGWAAGLLPLAWPELPGRAAYLLSVGATGGVLLGARAGEAWKPRRSAERTASWADAEAGWNRGGRIESRLRRVSARPGGWLRRAAASFGPSVAASLGAQAATWSQSLHHFSLASWTGLLVNLFAIPLAALTVPVLLLAGLVALHPAADSAVHVIVLARVLSGTLLDAIDLASRAGEMLIGSLAGTRAFFCTAAALASLWALMRVSETTFDPRSPSGVPSIHCPPPRWALRGRLSLLFAGFALVWGFVLPTWCARGGRPPERGFRATFLDVGQGDAVLLEIGRARWLYDTGPPPAHGLVRALEDAGVGRLDRVFLTHGDQDHWGGLAALLASPVRVDTVTISAGGPWPERFWESLEGAVSPGPERAFPPRARPVLERVGAGWERVWPSVRCRVLHPAPGFAADGRNDYSIVLRLEDGAEGDTPGAGRLLLIGDLESPGQESLLAEGTLEFTDVAQAGHHGSGTSLASGWYGGIAPRLVVASLGADNRYGFPHPSLVGELGERRIPLRRTDECGAVGLAWDGTHWRVRSGGAAPWKGP